MLLRNETMFVNVKAHEKGLFVYLLVNVNKKKMCKSFP